MRRRVLIRQDSIFNNDDPPDLFRAAKNDDTLEMSAAIHAGHDVNMTEPNVGFTPIHLASIHGSENFAEAISQVDGFDPWVRDNNNRLAIDHAVAFNHKRVQEILFRSMYPEVPPTAVRHTPHDPA